MSAAITLAGPDNLQPLLGLMARSHAERGLDISDKQRLDAATPLLDGNPLGAVWLIGPARAPLGYVIMTFGWSVPAGGMIGWIEDVYVRSSVRRRGIGTEVVRAVSVSLGQARIKAIHARVDPQNVPSAQFCARVGLTESHDLRLLTDHL